MKIKKNSIGHSVLFFVLATVLMITAPVSAEGIDLSIQDQTVATGSSITLSISVKNAEELGEADLEISYDPAVLQFSGIELSDVSRNGVIEATESRPGLLLVNVIDSAGISEDGRFISMFFTVIGSEGTTTAVSLTSKGAKNLDSEIVPVNVNSAQVTVTGAGLQAPLPAGIAVAAVCMAMAMVLWNRRIVK